MVIPRDVQVYRLPDGAAPFDQWLEHLRDTKTKSIILTRVNRVRKGLLGDCRSLGDGVYEFRIDFGPGYRIYFGQQGTRMVILLLGGDKSSQSADIKLANTYWEHYRRLSK